MFCIKCASFTFSLIVLFFSIALENKMRDFKNNSGVVSNLMQKWKNKLSYFSTDYSESEKKK